MYSCPRQRTARDPRDFAMIVEDTEETSARSGGARFEEQLLSGIKFTQDASLQFISAWFDGVAKLVTKVAEAPKPTLPAVTKPSEMVEFTRQMVSAQQKYVGDLLARKDPISFLSSLGEAGASLIKKPA